MPQQTITILRRGGHSDTIDADVVSHFAIHESIPLRLESYTLTHVPTGLCMLRVESERVCKRARKDLLESGYDWSSDDPAALSVEQRVFGQRLRERHGHLR